MAAADDNDTTASEGATYLVLVHPERFPSNDIAVIHPHAYLDMDAPVGFFDEWWWARIAAAEARHDRLVAVLDSCAMADLDSGWTAEIVSGVPVEGWEIVCAEPHQLDTLRPVPPGSKVTVAGFHRRDCVARVADRLRADGCDVTIGSHITLPLTDAEYADFVDQTA